MPAPIPEEVQSSIDNDTDASRGSPPIKVIAGANKTIPQVETILVNGIKKIEDGSLHPRVIIQQK